MFGHFYELLTATSYSFWRRRRAYKPVDVAPPLTDTQEDGDKKDVSTNVRLVRYDED